MKSRINLNVFALLLVWMFSACADDFDSMNIDPSKGTTVSADRLFPFVLGKICGDRFENARTNLITCALYTQQLASKTEEWSGDRYMKNEGHITAFWNTAYKHQVKNIEVLRHTLKNTEKDAGGVIQNQIAITKIIRSFIYLRLTDLHGAVPYSEAGLGHISGNITPKYDTQEEIYTSIFSELKTAVGELNEKAASFGTGDLVYGNGKSEEVISNWKKFANSLRLRMAMRLTKVNPTLAKQEADAAIAAGVMDNVDATAFINHYNGGDNYGLTNNGVSQVFIEYGYNGHHFRVSEKMAEIIKKNKDPRTKYLFGIYWKNNKDDEDLQKNEDLTYEDINGFPNGLSSSELGELSKKHDFHRYYAQPNKTYMVDRDAPTILQSYAEVCFLKAEYELRWGTKAKAQTEFEKGLNAAIDMLKLYGAPVGELTKAIRDEFVANVGEVTHENIGEQMWMALFLDGYESFSNWRRTGFPTLKPTNFSGNATNGQIPRRLIYPSNESSMNGANYQQAIKHQGDDELTTRVWWDAK
ncbi:MAG: SusD/RagB family nutrient-binding outer membrane lipoprotein [Cytophagales bacterium]|nr:SusD/RagB family nutrient-binding outer membrane lipoprotein [Cytophagales bacterium]